MSLFLRKQAATVNSHLHVSLYTSPNITGISHHMLGTYILQGSTSHARH